VSKKKFESFEELQKKRRGWVEANQENDFEDGIKNLLTELYPDNAHFIFELLQNAEDARIKSNPTSKGAKKVSFLLKDNALQFQHNGEGLFTLDNVVGITGIGSSPTKRDDPTAIGKFGVGFKAVFAYTNTPEIHSGDFHFRIHDLVVPGTEGVEQSHAESKQTCFLFPFDNPKKPAITAVQEIEKGLCALDDSTLLFLNYIRKIDYTLPDGSIGSLERIRRKNGRIEVRSSRPHSEVTVSHWLHFQKDVEVTDDDGKPKMCRIAIAYQLERETGKNKEQSVWKIVSVNGGGQVSIYFPAEKETSKLRFHLHAPFASTVARDSVRDCPANDQLRDHLATLIVESLTAIRDQGFLTMSFLAVLPNPKDSLTEFYEPIRQAIVEAFKNQPLTPTKKGNHTKADVLYRGLVRIADVINDEDLSLLTNDETALWSANAPRNHQREVNFLDSLEIKKWEFEHLSAIFKQTDQEKIQSWLAEKNDEWLMNFYELLNEAKERHDNNQPRWQKQHWPGLSFPFVRVDSAQGVKHVAAQEAYFAPEDNNISPTADLLIIKQTVYVTGDTSNDINHPAKNFLQNIGVKPFDAKAAIELRLRHYQSPPEQIEDSHYEDIKQFVSYWKNNQKEKELFQTHSFLIADLSDNKPDWQKPTKLCIDNPFLETGLAELEEIHHKKAIWLGYSRNLDENNLKDFVEFVKAIGVMFQLEVIELQGEEAKKNLNKPYGQWRRDTERALDYSIRDVEKYLDAKTISASKLIWNALIHAKDVYGTAKFMPNKKDGETRVDSQLICSLKKYAWIPNVAGEFCTPQAMTHENLRDDFILDKSNGLLTKIGFGKNAEDENQKLKNQELLISYNHQQKNKKAQDIGFSSASEAEEAIRIIKEAGGINKLRSIVARRKQTELPNESVLNPKRRREKVLENSAYVPDKESVQRERSIQKNISEVKAQAKAYLRPTYQNDYHEFFCQCCDVEMPFKLNELHYFEAVQCVKSQEKRYHQNYLALCPVCAAMYKYARTTDDTEIRRLIVEHDAPDDAGSVEIPVTLAGQQYRLRFVGTHWFDLKTVFENSDANLVELSF
jgi:hypothetical protein